MVASSRESNSPRTVLAARLFFGRAVTVCGICAGVDGVVAPRGRAPERNRLIVAAGCRCFGLRALHAQVQRAFAPGTLGGKDTDQRTVPGSTAIRVSGRQTDPRRAAPIRSVCVEQI